VNARSRFLRREPDKAQERALRICIKDRRTREQLRSISSDAVESAATELQELARQLTAYAAARGAMLKAGVPDEGVRIGKN
jgi:translation initiation factor 1 (eIF-1/SUI1)